MFIDLFSGSCKEGEEFPCWVNEDQPEFLVIFYKLFEVSQTHRIRNASLLLAIFGKCTLVNYCNDY